MSCDRVLRLLNCTRRDVDLEDVSTFMLTIGLRRCCVTSYDWLQSILLGTLKKWWGIQVMETCKPAIRWASRTTLDPTKPHTNDNYSISYAHMHRPALHYRKSGRMYFHNRLVFCIARLLTYVSTHNSAYLVFM